MYVLLAEVDVSDVLFGDFRESATEMMEEFSAP